MAQFESLGMCFLARCLSLFTIAVSCIGYREVTIHIGGNDHWVKVDPNLWPCLERSTYEQYISINNYGCIHSFFKQGNDRVSWQIPEREGPIRLSAEPDLCLDARRASHFLERNETFSPASNLESVVERAVVLSPCDGSASQHFILDDNRGGGVIIRLASNPAWALKFDVAALTLQNKWELHSTAFSFYFVEFRDPHSAFVLGGGAGAYAIMRSLHVWQVLLLLIYCAVYCKRAFACGFRVEAAVAFLQELCLGLMKRPDAKVNALANERRVHRANFILSKGLHLGVFWILFVGLESFFKGSVRIETAVWKLSSGEYLSTVSMTTLCVAARLGLIRSARVLDVLTVMFSFLWAAQYYLLSQSLGGWNIENYYFLESYMMMARLLLNIVIGRLAVSVPCTIAVTVVDVYALSILTPLHTQTNLSARFYYVKQSSLCAMTCVMHYCVERLASHEVQSTIEVHKSELYEQLATRLTVSMCDAVVHLGSDLTFSKPAPKLANMLFRHQLGAFPTLFLNLLPVEEHERFKNYLKHVDSADVMEPLMPIHVSLLDASGSRCQVQIYGSSYRDDEKTVHYILGVGEVHDYGFRSNEGANAHVDRFDSHSQIDNAEGSIFDSDSDTSLASSFSDDASRGEEMSFGVTVLHRSGIVVSADPAFGDFMRADLVGTCLFSVFHDSPAACAWLQMKVDSFQSTLPSSPRERTSGTCVLLRGKSRFDSTLVVCDVHVQEEVSTVTLTVRVGRRHRRKERFRRQASSLLASASETVPLTYVISVNASASRIERALERLQDPSAMLFELLSRQSCAQWQAWWNECIISFQGAPFSASQEEFAFEIIKHGTRRYLASVHWTIREDSAECRRLMRRLKLTAGTLSCL